MSELHTHNDTPSAPEVIGSDTQSLRDYASNLSWERKQREGSDEVVKIHTDHYTHPDRVEENSAGDEVNKGISAREAAKSVSAAREAERLETESWQETLRLAEAGDTEGLRQHLGEAGVEPATPTEQPRERPYTQQQSTDPGIDEIRQVAAHIEHSRNAVAQDAAAVAQNIQAMFPEIRFMSGHEAQDIAALAHSNPARHQMLVQAAGVVQQVAARAQQVHAAETQLYQIAANHQQQQQLTAWKAEQSRIVEAKHPELRTDARGNYVEPEKAVALQHKAVALLRETHSDAEIQAAITDGRLDDAKNVLILLEAVKYRDAQAQAKAKLAVPKPPVMRPGVRQAVNSQDDEVTAATNAFHKNPTVRSAARLRAAKRAAAEQ